MLHTRFRENRPAGSGEEDFWSEEKMFENVNGRTDGRRIHAYPISSALSLWLR